MTAALTTLLAWPASDGHARRVSRTAYRNAKAGIQVYLPKGWHQQATAAYPGLLVAFHHDAGARLLVSVRTRKTSETPHLVAAATAKTLRARGMRILPLASLRVGHLPAVLLETTSPDGKHRLRQLFAVQGKRLYVLSFWIPEARRADYNADFQYILRTTRIAK